MPRQFFPEPIFRNDALKCLTEIASLELEPEYDTKFQEMFFHIIPKLSEVQLPFDTPAGVEGARPSLRCPLRSVPMRMLRGGHSWPA